MLAVWMDGLTDGLTDCYSTSHGEMALLGSAWPDPHSPYQPGGAPLFRSGVKSTFNVT